MFTVVTVGKRAGVFSFSTGYIFKREQTLLEWAKNDFDACFNYLLRQGKEDMAEELFKVLTRGNVQVKMHKAQSSKAELEREQRKSKKSLFFLIFFTSTGRYLMILNKLFFGGLYAL